MSDNNIIKLPCCGPPCRPERHIGIGELSWRVKVSPYYLRKWADNGDIPCVHVPGSNRIFPEFKAVEAVMRLLEDNRLDRPGQDPPSMN